MWAGGGLAHADPQRVRPVVDLHRYTVCAVSRFPFVGEIDCDAVELTNVSHQEVYIFALTLVRAPAFAAEATQSRPGGTSSALTASRSSIAV